MPPRRPLAQSHPYPRLRGRGALLGLAIGDALGAPTKGRPLHAPAFPQLADGLYRSLRGGGPFELKKGQVGENGQLACALGAALREQGTYDANAVLRRYLAWNNQAQMTMTDPLLDVMTELGESHLPRLTAGRRLWMRGQRRQAHNGSLARTAPIGVFFHADAQARLEASLADSVLTHFDPRCQLACAVLNAAIAHAIGAGEGLEKEALFTAAVSGLRLASSTLGRTHADLIHEVSTATAVLNEDLELARQEDPQLYWPDMHMHRKQDNVRVAFRLAFWELMHTESFEEALVDVAHRGGDADVNGAVTGALLGAFYGEDAIPSDWQQGVLGALGPSAGQLWSVFHPRHLMLLAPE